MLGDGSSEGDVDNPCSVACDLSREKERCGDRSGHKCSHKHSSYCHQNSSHRSSCEEVLETSKCPASAERSIMMRDTVKGACYKSAPAVKQGYRAPHKPHQSVWPRHVGGGPAWVEEELSCRWAKF